LNKNKFNDLILLAQKGDELAFNKILNQSMPCINADIDRIHRNCQFIDRDEFLSLAMLAFWETIKIYDPRNPSFLHFLRIIVRRILSKEVAKNQIQRNNRRLNVGYVDCLSKEEEGEGVEKEVISNEFRYEINTLMRYLTPHEARVYKLYFRNYYPKQIADTLGLKIKSVYNAIYSSEKKIINNYRKRGMAS
jgi:RNA polymerase sigma factor (sigma-70 family)